MVASEIKRWHPRTKVSRLPSGPLDVRVNDLKACPTAPKIQSYSLVSFHESTWQVFVSYGKKAVLTSKHPLDIGKQKGENKPNMGLEHNLETRLGKVAGLDGISHGGSCKPIFLRSQANSCFLHLIIYCNVFLKTPGHWPCGLLRNLQFQNGLVQLVSLFCKHILCIPFSKLWSRKASPSPQLPLIYLHFIHPIQAQSGSKF